MLKDYLKGGKSSHVYKDVFSINPFQSQQHKDNSCITVLITIKINLSKYFENF
jgi:hypothetical protein